MSGISVDQIIDKSKQWSLEGDSTLLRWMEQISKDLEVRVTATNNAMDEMTTRLDRATVALANVTNNLAALQYSQFVENRVQEDDESLTKVVEAPNPPEDEVDKGTTPNVLSFLKKNLEMMHSSHEAYSLSYDDSDEEEPATNVVYRAKNPYNATPLPFIYGSEPWKEKWHIGLLESDPEFSGDEESENLSNSSPANDSYGSYAPTISEWDSTPWGLNANPILLDQKEIHSQSINEDLSGQPQEIISPKPNPRMITFDQPPIQSKQYYQHVPRKAENINVLPVDTTERCPSQDTYPPVANASPNTYIPTEPPPDEIEETTPRPVAKKTLNLFDDDEFSSFMDQIVQSAAAKQVKAGNLSHQPNPQLQVTEEYNNADKKLPSAEINDLGQSINARIHSFPYISEKSEFKQNPNDFRTASVQPIKTKSNTEQLENMSQPQNSEPAIRHQHETTPRKPRILNLFDNTDDIFSPKLTEESPSLKSDLFAEDNLFESVEPPKVSSKTPLNLFDDDDDDDFESIFAKPTAAIRTARERSSISFDKLTTQGHGSTSSLPAKTSKTSQLKELLKTNLFGDEDDILDKDQNISNRPSEDSRIDLAPTTQAEMEPKTKVTTDFRERKENIFADIFQDTRPNDDFGSVSGAKKNAFVDIFAEDFEDDFEELISKPTTKSKGQIVSDKKKHRDDDQNKESTKSDAENITETTIASLPAAAVLDSNKPASNVASSLVTVSEVELPASNLDLPKSSEGVHTANDSVPVLSQVLPDSDIVNSTPKTDLLAVASDFLTSSVSSSPLPDSFSGVGPTSTQIADNSNNQNLSRPDQLKPVLDLPESSDNQMKKDFPTSVEDFSTFKSDSKAKNVELSEADTGSTQRTNKLTEVQRSNHAQPLAEDVSLESKSKLEGFRNSSSFLRDIKPLDHTVQSQDSSVQGVSEVEQMKIEAKPSSHSSNKESTEFIPEVSPRFVSPLNIFADEPPTDEFSVVPNIKQAVTDDGSHNNFLTESGTKHIPDEENLHSIPSVSSYTNINLFDDVPPEDDFHISPSKETKRIHSVFYDDFPETIVASREVRPPSSYIFTDEPPPDETGHQLPTTGAVEESKAKAVSQISRSLKANLNINVHALLPSNPKTYTVKGIKESTDNLQKEGASNTPDSEQKVQIQPKVENSKHDLERPENILPNLNKDRVKISVKRRPSTRRGRQESYKNSTKDLYGTDYEQDESGDQHDTKLPAQDPREHEIQKSFNEDSNTTKTNDLPSLQGNAVDMKPLLQDKENPSDLNSPLRMPSTSIDSDATENPFKSPLKISDEFERAAAMPVPIDVAHTSQVIDEEPRDNVKSTQKVVKTSVFSDSEEDSDSLFNPEKGIQKKKAEKTHSTKPNKTGSSLFFSDDSGSEDDLFGKPKQQSREKKMEPIKPISAPNLFVDSLSDDDENLFATSSKKTAEVTQSATKMSPNSSTTTKTFPTTPQQELASNNPLADLLDS